MSAYLHPSRINFLCKSDSRLPIVALPPKRIRSNDSGKRGEWLPFKKNSRISSLSIGMESYPAVVTIHEGIESVESVAHCDPSEAKVSSSSDGLPDFNDIFTWFSASLCLLIALADGPLPNLILPQNAALLLLAAVQWGLIALPTLAYCYHSEYDLKATFLLNWSKAKYIVASVVGGFSLWILLTVTIWQKMWAFSAFLPAPLPNKDVILSMFQIYPNTTLGWAFLLLWAAIAPAVAQEFIFRGYLLTCLKPHLLRIDAIVLAGALGGMFHLNLPQFLATTALGVMAGSLATVSGSIIPAILLHVTHNIAALVFGGFFRQTPLSQSMALFPTWMVGAAIYGMLFSCSIILPAWFHSWREERQTEEYEE